ncbi:MAG: MarR family transcriptional regulator [Chloroflexi bacterium]|nr:MarR family transcriptional regulator [Chloroflexota bacterium]
MEDQELLEQLAGIEQLILRVGWLEQRRFAQDLDCFGLTPPQFFVLRSIASHDKNPTMSTLAYDTLQHCATVTGIVDRLVRMGLVTRKRGAQDRRQVLVELTPLGRDLLDKVRSSREKRLRETLLRLSREDAKELLRLLRTYLEACQFAYEEDSLQENTQPIE